MRPQMCNERIAHRMSDTQNADCASFFVLNHRITPRRFDPTIDLTASLQARIQPLKLSTNCGCMDRITYG